MPLVNFDRVLKWSDFKEKAAVKADDGATIGVSWEEEHEPQREGNAITVKKLKVTIVMPDPEMNTVVKEKKTEAMRKHEQGHYDIIALGAREFYRRGLKLSAASDTELNTKFDDLFTEVYDKATAVDARYDKRTDHHLKTDVQKQWDAKIEELKKSKTGTVDDLPE